MRERESLIAASPKSHLYSTRVNGLNYFPALEVGAGIQ
jgi:hypothetical protein